MSTGSTKSGKKHRVKTHPAETDNPLRVVETPIEKDIPEPVWRFGVVGIFIVGAILRLYDLNLVPMHHDEGVNGNFLLRLVREGSFRYDPENYHGPTLYYFSAIIPWFTKLLFGSETSETYALTTFNVRLVTVVFGLATIGLVFLLRRRLGSVGTLSAGLMLAISPGAVYLSRYYIHETLFVFFTLGIVVAAIYFYDKRNPSYLIPAAASAALLFATKETAMISAGVMIIALALTVIYVRLHSKAFVAATPKRSRARPSKGRVNTVIDEMGGTPNVATYAGFALLAFLVVYLLFYSSFFQNSQGIYDSLKTFAIWTKTGTTAHVHPRYQYLIWLGGKLDIETRRIVLGQEAPLLILGVVGAVLVLLKPRAMALFCALWSFGLIAAYSLIPYKTPWLLLNFVVPLALIAGHALQAIYELDLGQLRLVSAILFVAAGMSLYQSIDLNFINYDNDKPQYVYVYAHTKRDMLALVDEVDRIAKEEAGAQTGITVISPDYWPLPWYFRGYMRVGYFGRMAASTEPIIIANANQKVEVDAAFGELYEQVPSREEGGGFELRPGVSLILYRRRS